MSKIDPIDIKCKAFNKDEIWIFNPESSRQDIIQIINYGNSLREENLKSLPFS